MPGLTCLSFKMGLDYKDCFQLRKNVYPRLAIRELRIYPDHYDRARKRRKSPAPPALSSFRDDKLATDAMKLWFTLTRCSTSSGDEFVINLLPPLSLAGPDR